MNSSPHQRLFAFVIGIDDYEDPKIPRLRGAVADSKAIAQWLQDELKVSPARIFTLRNQQATRRNIIDTLIEMKNSYRIRDGDPIFVYYAGYGSEARSPDSWDDHEGWIETIIPWDISHTIPPIPGRTISFLLTELAEAKGDNITVVFDCSYSVSGARRNWDSPEGLERNLNHNFGLPRDVDQDILTRLAQRPMGSWRLIGGGQRAFVMLAACHAREQAREDGSHGLFTSTFLSALTPLVEDVTYSELVEQLPNIPGQSPQCSGYYRNRLFLNGDAPKRSTTFITVKYTHGIYQLNAGEAQGITVDSEFTIHADNTIIPKDNPPLCTLRAIKTESFKTVLNPVDIPPVTFALPAYALQVRYGKENALRVHCTPALMKALYDGIIKAIPSGELDARIGFILTDRHDADLVMDLVDTEDGNKVIFQHMLFQKHGLKQIPHVVAPEDKHISHVLRLAARWHHHINRTKEVSRRDLELEFKRLYRSLNSNMLRPCGTNLVRNGVVRLTYQQNEEFGVEIVNHTRVDLFAYVFWFGSDQRIIPLYRGSFGRDRTEPLVRAGSTFTVGYGTYDSMPLKFTLNDREEMNVGFIKVFFTTSSADFDLLATDSESWVDRTRSVNNSYSETGVEPKWDTLLTTVVLRKGTSIYTAALDPDTRSFTNNQAAEQTDLTIDIAAQNRPLSDAFRGGIPAKHAYSSQQFLRAMLRLDDRTVDLSQRVVRKGDRPIRGGGFCDIYRGELHEAGHVRTVAMKQLRVYTSWDAQQQAHGLLLFQREVSFWSSFEHRFILPLYGFSVHNQANLYMISPWIDNGDCMQYLLKNPTTNRAKLLWQVAEALEYLHSGGSGAPCIHGDIKGDNVLISDSGDVLLCDFGLMRHVEAVATAMATPSGVPPMGHIRFSAPELLFGDMKPSSASDVFAFGRLMLQIFTGLPPFPSLNNSQVCTRVLQRQNPQRPDGPEALAFGLDDGMWALANECWEHDPSRRPTMLDVASRLKVFA